MTRRIAEHEIEWASGPPSSLGWFNVTDADYGATGDGVTDDTAAINAAIAALNTAGRGVLYFPAGTYLCTAGLTTITAHARIVGDGAGDLQAQNAATTVKINSTTATLLTLAGDGIVMENLALENPTTTTQTAGAGIHVTQGDLNRFRNVSVRGFYDCVDIEDGALWTMDSCYLVGPVRYGLRIRHVDLVDGGDQAITNCAIYGEDRNATSAIRYESGGGLKITNCKINDLYGTGRFTRGIDVELVNVGTVILLVSNTSIENITTNAIRVTHTGSGEFRHVILNGVQAAFYQAGSTPAVDISNVANVIVDGVNLTAPGGARACAAIALTNVTDAVIGDRITDGFTAGDYSESGSTGVIDSMVGGAVDSVNGQTGVVVLDAASVGAAEAGHTHAGSSGGELLMQDGVTSPPVPIETEAGDDWLYEG